MAKSDSSRRIDFKYRTNGNIILKRVLPFFPSDSDYKLALFMNSGGYFGYINEEGLVVIPPKYLNARNFKSFNNQLRAIVMEKADGRRYRLIDENGNNISSLYDDMYFDGDFIVAKKGKKYGILNTNGKEVEPFIYDEISNGVGKIIITSGKYKGYEKYYYFYNGNSNAKYGRPTSRIFEMSTQEIPDDRNDVKYSHDGEAYINPSDLKGNRAYVNIESGHVLMFTPVTNFKALEISKGFVDLRAIALDKSYPESMCLIDRKGHILLSAPFQSYIISETNNNMYLIKSRRYDLCSLYDMNGNYIVGECNDIKVCDSGLIVGYVGHYNLYDEKGNLLNTDKEYVNVIGNKTEEYLVAEYYDENKKLKSEIIDRKGKRVIKNIHYDNTTGFVNGYAVLEINKTDYSMNDPYHYFAHIIVNIHGAVIFEYPEYNPLNSFESIENYADKGFFIAKYLNKKEFSVIGLNGKEIFNIECDNLIYKNGIFIASYKEDDKSYTYNFFDKNGCNIFNKNIFDSSFTNYEFLSDKCFTVTSNGETIFISFSNAEVVDINSIPHTINYGYWNIVEPFIRELGSDLSKREKILCRDVTQEYTNIKRYILVDKNHTKIKPLLNTWSLCIKKTDNGSECCEIIGEIKDKLKYFDLSVNSFYGIDVRGIDFSETNAFIDPQIVYNRSLDGCKLNSSNLTIHKSKLKELGISCEGTIIDGELVEKGHERKLIL